MATQVFGKFLHYPGGCHRMGYIALGLGYKSRPFPGVMLYLGKQRHMPNEDFHFSLRFWDRAYFSLALSLVPEKQPWIAIAAVLTLVAFLLGRAEINLWGDGYYTGGQYDTFGSRPIPYVIMDSWQDRASWREHIK